MAPGVPEIEGLEDLQAIGRGGFSTVYRAWQPSAARHVAVKVLETTLDDESRPRFERECQLLGQLAAHPGICTLYTSGQTSDDRPYLVLELCAGSLADRVRDEGPLSVEETVTLLRRVGTALAHSHARGIVHRDVKPENVLVTQFGDPALTDFGIARADASWRTTSGLVTASIAHAAPEVLDGEPPTPRSDLWSLASTGYHLLLGHPPFRRGDEPSSVTVTRIFRDPPPDLRPLGVPGGLCDLLEAGLAKDPADRPSDVATFVSSLRDGPVPGAPARSLAPFGPGTREPTVSLPRDAVPPGEPTAVREPDPPHRRRWPLAIGGLVAVATVAVGAVLLVGDDDPGGDAASATTTSSTAATGLEAVADLRGRMCVAGTDGSLGLRSSPSAPRDDSNLLTEIAEGDCRVRDASTQPELRDDTTGNPWRHVEVDGRTGWAFTENLVPLTRLCVVDTSPLNLRGEPTVDGAVVASIPVGACDVFDHGPTPVTSPSDGREWREVWWGDLRGWVAAELVELAPA